MAFEDERAEGRAEAIIELLEESGQLSVELRQTIMEQKDTKILREWLKRAACAKDIKDFEEFLKGRE